MTLTLACAAALPGCPSLGEIGVGGGDAGADTAPPDHRGDVEPRDARARDILGDACTASPATDPKNCGRCGHDCQGGACRAGVCQAYAIVTGSDSPYGIAVHAGALYFTTGFLTVETCKADHCMSSLGQIASKQGAPRGIVTDETSVYWANVGLPFDGGNAGSIATCGLAGCPKGNPTLLSSAADGPVDIAVDTSAVYWTNYDNGVVRSCTIGGCGDMPTTLATDAAPISGVAVDATSIYWAEPMLGNVIQCPLAGCATFGPFASGQVGAAKVDTVNGSVYWSTQSAIMRCPATGCGGAPEVFAKGQPSAYAIAHDAVNLYWSLYAKAGKVLRCPLSGCTTPEVLADEQDMPAAIAVDTDSVYFTDRGGGTVMRVMK